jgi:radial spoke head protein 1
VKNGRPFGVGRMTYRNGEIYEGHFESGKKHGQGVFSYFQNKNYVKYEGNFKDNKLSGTGTMFYKDGTKYSGDFENWLRNGLGTLNYPVKDPQNGLKYVGNYKNDKKSGAGNIIFIFYSIVKKFFGNNFKVLFKF